MKKRKVALKRLCLDKGVITDLSIATKDAIKGGATLPPTTPAGPNTPPDCWSCPNTLAFSCPNNC